MDYLLSWSTRGEFETWHTDFKHEKTRFFAHMSGGKKKKSIPFWPTSRGDPIFFFPGRSIKFLSSLFKCTPIALQETKRQWKKKKHRHTYLFEKCFFFHTVRNYHGTINCANKHIRWGRNTVNGYCIRTDTRAIRGVNVCVVRHHNRLVFTTIITVIGAAITREVVITRRR